MDSNADISARRVLGMDWLWLVCFFHLVTSLEGKNQFYVILKRIFFRGEKCFQDACSSKDDH